MVANPIPEAWLSKCKMEKVVVHWTAGSNTVSNLDKQHYHIIISGAGNLVRGTHQISDNARPMNTSDYAAHTLNFNAGAIGISLAGMAGAVESPFKAGPHPINATQWAIAATAVAQICDVYNIPVTYTTVLQHGEVEKNTGTAQRGKWDCCKLPWAPTMTPDQVCSQFRQLVMKVLLERHRLDLVPKSNGGTR